MPMQEMGDLPAKCFISHAYADRSLTERLIHRLPAGVEAVVFPPISVSPEQLVSDRLIASLLDCDGLIYLQGGHSETSFWVAFERDYAARAGKLVFAADPRALTIVADRKGPMDLAAFASYHRDDAGQVGKIVSHLKIQRHIDVWLDVEALRAGESFADEISESLTDRLARGGYAIVFWSHRASQSDFVRREIEMAADGIANFNDRVLFALLDDEPIPQFWAQFQEPAVQLYSDGVRPATHRLDDLVVRLYWLIYRKTRTAKLTHG